MAEPGPRAARGGIAALAGRAHGECQAGGSGTRPGLAIFYHFLAILPAVIPLLSLFVLFNLPLLSYHPITAPNYSALKSLR